MSRIRRLLERLSRDRVLARRLPARCGGGRVFVSPDCGLRYWRHDLERAAGDLFDLAVAHVRAGDRVWDVGANQGLFALAAARAAGASGAVVALEPDPFCAALIERSAACAPAGCAPVRVLRAAASDACGTARLALAARGRTTNHLDRVPGSSQTGGARGHLDVDAIRLDDLLLDEPPPAFVKIDVEGHELAVLRGATELLAAHRPRLALEVADRDREAVTALLHEHGYELYDARQPDAGRLERAAFDTLALPRALAA